MDPDDPTEDHCDEEIILTSTAQSQRSHQQSYFVTGTNYDAFVLAQRRSNNDPSICMLLSHESTVNALDVLWQVILTFDAVHTLARETIRQQRRQGRLYECHEIGSNHDMGILGQDEDESNGDDGV